MREDMYKVIIDVGRSGSWMKHRRQKKGDIELLSGKMGMRRHAKGGGRWKWQRDRLQPLRRYLMKQAGRPWNKVYNEICATLDVRSTVKDHVKLHLEDFVNREVILQRDGSFADQCTYWSDRDWRQPLYVDPRDGILKESEKLWRKRRRRLASQEQEPPVTVRKLSRDEELHRLGGLWYRVRYGVNDTRYKIADAATGERVWPGQRAALSKRQLSKAELKQYGLSNQT